MKFGNFEIPPKKEEAKEKELGKNAFLLEENKEIFNILTDPEFVKTFPEPSSYQYTTLKFNLIESKEYTQKSLACLKEFLEENKRPIPSLIRFTQFIHNALGNKSPVKFIAKKERRAEETLKNGLKNISINPKINYFAGILIDPEIVLRKIQDFEKMEKELTPIQISGDYFIQDNRFDPIPIFYHTDNIDELNSSIKGQSKFFEDARSKEQEEKYVDTKIRFNNIKSEVGEKIKNSTKRLSPEEIMKFFPDSKNIYELTQDELLMEFRSFIDPEIRKRIEKDFNLKLTEIPMKEQIYFLTSIMRNTNETIKHVQDFSKKFSAMGVRTFLSIEQGGKEMGDKILALGEKLPEVAGEIFKKYGEIIDNVNKIVEFAQHNFKEEIKTSPELVRKIEETLFLKGKQLLSQIYDDINSEKKINIVEIQRQLDRINADTITTFAIFKQSVKNGEKLPIESIEGSVFSKKEATDIGDNQQNEMLELYESNWKNHPDRDFVESLKSYFKTAFIPEDNKQKNYFYTFEKDNNIRAFVRFEKQKDASFYASALNVDEASKNFGLGEAMMDEALTREAKEHILHASCRKDNPSNMRYFEKGFIARGFKKTNETEEFDIVWDENKNKNIKAKQKSQGELISIYGNIDTEEIEIKKSKDLESLHGDIPEGKSLVRCFVNNGEWYAVYEVIKDDYGMNLGETK